MSTPEHTYFDAKERWIMRRTIELCAQRKPRALSREYHACRDEAEREYEQMQNEGEEAA